MYNYLFRFSFYMILVIKSFLIVILRCGFILRFRLRMERGGLLFRREGLRFF